MKKKILQILMLFSAFFLTTNVFGQTNGFYLLNQGNNKYLQMKKAATDTSTSKNDGQFGFVDSKDASTTCWTFTQYNTTNLVKFADSSDQSTVYFGDTGGTSSSWQYKLNGIGKYNSKPESEAQSQTGGKYNCYLYKISNYTADGTSFTATLTTTAEVDGYYFIASANVKSSGTGLMLMGNELSGSTQITVAGTQISDTPNTTNITVNVSDIQNYIYKFEDAGSTPTPTPTPTSNTFYLKNYGNKKYLNANGTALDHSDTPIEWTVEQVNTSNNMNISPKGETNHLNYTSSSFRLNSNNSTISLYKIENIYASNWSLKATTQPDAEGYYVIVGLGSQYYAMGVDISNNDLSKLPLGKSSITLSKSEANQAYVYQFISPGSTPEPEPLPSLDGDKYYITNGSGSSMEFLSGGTDGSIALETNTTNGQWTVTTGTGSSSGSFKFKVNGSHYLRCEPQTVDGKNDTYIFNTSGSTKSIDVYDIDGNKVTALQTNTPYYFVYSNYCMGNEAKSYKENSKTYYALSAKSVTISNNKLTTSLGEDYQFTLHKAEPKTYYGQLTVVANDNNYGNVSVNPATSGTTVWTGNETNEMTAATQELTLTATPTGSCTFMGWSNDGGETIIDNSNVSPYTYKFNYNSTTQNNPTNVTLTAVFEPATYYGKLTVAANDANFGTVSVDPATSGTTVWSDSDVTTAEKGSKKLTIKAVPNTGYQFKEWQKGGVVISGATAEYNYTFEFTSTTQDTPTEETLTAVFEAIPVTGVNLNMEETNVKVGETVTLIATILPENATNKNVTWSSDNKNVAKVENGVVTAVATGKATITVTTEDGSKTAKCTVIVIESKESWDDIVVSTIPMSTEGGNAATAATVIVGGKSYPAIKAGTEDTRGKVVIKVPAGITKVRVHLNGWQNETTVVSIKATGSDSEIYTLKADNGVEGDENTFTLQNHPYDNCYTIILAQNADVKSNGLRKSAVDGQTEITIEATEEGGGRFVMYGITGNEYTLEVNPTTTDEFVYGTICLPSYGDVTTEGDVQFFTIHHKSDATVTVDEQGTTSPCYITLQEVEATELESGTPYIYKATKTFTVKLPEEKIAVQPVAATGLVGTFSEIKPLDTGYYIIYNNLLYVVNSTNVIIDPLHAYIDLKDVPTESEVLNPTPGVKMFNFFYNEADGIMNIYDNGFNVNDNVNVNGNVNVNLNGQAVGAEYKGIVIMNGKKVLRR